VKGSFTIAVHYCRWTNELPTPHRPSAMREKLLRPLGKMA
jgi:hypothetical protein